MREGRLFSHGPIKDNSSAHFWIIKKINDLSKNFQKKFSFCKI